VCALLRGTHNKSIKDALGRRKHVGYFDTEDEAAAARLVVAREMHGQFLSEDYLLKNYDADEVG
jgi:hypothetical protein